MLWCFYKSAVSLFTWAGWQHLWTGTWINHLPVQSLGARKGTRMWMASNIIPRMVTRRMEGRYKYWLNLLLQNYLTRRFSILTPCFMCFMKLVLCDISTRFSFAYTNKVNCDFFYFFLSQNLKKKKNIFWRISTSWVLNLRLSVGFFSVLCHEASHNFSGLVNITGLH